MLPVLRRVKDRWWPVLEQKLPFLTDIGPWKVTLSRFVVIVIFYCACVYVMSGEQ